MLASILETWVKSDNALQLRHLRHDLMAAPSLLLDGIRSIGPSAVVVRYEELVSAPEEATRRLCSQLGMEFHQGMIEYGAVAGGTRWMFGDQGTVYREGRPVPGYADRWRSVLRQSPVWMAWARSYLDALGPDLVRDLGYDCAELSADFSAVPTGRDWDAVTRSDESEQALLHGQLERAVAAIERQDRHAAALQAAADERGRALEAAHAEMDRLRCGAEERDLRHAAILKDFTAELIIREAALDEARTQLERAVATISQQDERAGILQLAADERLAALEETDRAIAGLNAQLAASDAALAEARAQLERAVATVNQQEQRAGILQAAADERRSELGEKDRAIAGLDTELAAREAALDEARAQLERAVTTVNQQEERAGILQAAADERLSELHEKDRALVGLHAEVATRDAALDEARSQLERAVATVNEQEQRAAILQSAADERLIELQEKDCALVGLQAELVTRDAALAEARSQLECAVATLNQQEQRAGILQAAADERLAALEETDRVLAGLRAELAARDAAFDEARAQLERAVAITRQREQALIECQTRLDQLVSERDRLVGENGASSQRILAFETETLRDYLRRRFRRKTPGS